MFRKVVVEQLIVLLNQWGGSGSRRRTDVCRQGAGPPHPTDGVTCMYRDTASSLPVCGCVCGGKPTYAFGSFIVWAVSLINHQALWKVHWGIDPEFSVWTYGLSVYRQPYWQLLWLSDSYRAADTNCNKTLMDAKARSSSHAVNITAGARHSDSLCIFNSSALFILCSSDGDRLLYVYVRMHSQCMQSITGQEHMA